MPNMLIFSYMEKSIITNFTKLCALTHPEEFDERLFNSDMKTNHGNKIVIAENA